MMKSLLFVPGDNERMLAKASMRGADALIVDLEDAVAPDRKRAARDCTASFLAEATYGSTDLYVRVNALTTGELLSDLVAIVPAHPSGIVLPKCRNRADLEQVSHYISALEASAGMDEFEIRLLVLVTETADATLSLAHESYAHPRVDALMWGGEDLSADVGALFNRRPDGEYDHAYKMARSLTLLSAARAGVMAIDSVFTDIDDLATLEEECIAARREGFGAKCAIHPGQVETINRVFTPSEAEREWAAKVVEALSHGAGAVRVDGKMIDIAHLRLAERLLA